MNIFTAKKLRSGAEMPALGLGVFKSGADTYNAVRAALDEGYRHIDTAMIYGNEDQVGRAVKDSGIQREKLFITTKAWTTDIRAGKVIEGCETSLRLLGMDYVDLYLLHWPVKGGNSVSYEAVLKLQAAGKTKAAGVSNFLVHHLETLSVELGAVPEVDQVEMQPYLTGTKLLEYCKEKHIVAEAWSPLARGRVTSDPVILAIGDKYGKTAAQTVIRWHLQRGVAVIPKSVHRERIAENKEVFDFELSKEDMEAINALDKGFRCGSSPDDYRW